MPAAESERASAFSNPLGRSGLCDADGPGKGPPPHPSGVGTADRRPVRDRLDPGAFDPMDVLIPLCSAAAVGLMAAVLVLTVVVPMVRGLFAGGR